MLIAVRHNRTSFNEDGKEKLRGWLNIPLSNEGKQDAFDTAKKLKDLKLSVDNFYSSPLKRAVQTANEIENELDIKYKLKDELKDWNTGVFTGKPVEDNLAKIHDYIFSKSDKSIPDGESFNSFNDRTRPFLKDLIESDKGNLIVTHNRVITLLKALSNGKGKKLDKFVMRKKGPIEPGGIILVEPDWNLSIAYNPKETPVGVS